MPTEAPQAPERDTPVAFAQQIRMTVRAWDWPTLALFVATIGVLALGLILPVGWGLVSFVLVSLALTMHSSLSHEILHGHPFRSERAGTLLGLIQPGILVPYQRFKKLHLDHHMDQRLTDPYDDPETNYLDPAVWDRLPRWQQAVARFNNTLFGRMLIGPVIGQVRFMQGDVARVRAGERAVITDWLLHLPGVALTLWLVWLSPMSLWAYLGACYVALAVLKIRTFLEHRAHARCSARTAIVEDRGLLAFLFLNNNLHVVHHMHPTVSWYHLPGLYRAHKERYQRRNQSYVYRSYGQIFREHLLRAKDPVPHPLWQDRAE